MSTHKIFSTNGVHLVPALPSIKRCSAVPLGFKDFLDYYVRSIGILVESKIAVFHKPVRAEFKLPHSCSTYVLPEEPKSYAALVPAGWVPARFAGAAVLMLDTNIAGSSPRPSPEQSSAQNARALSLIEGGSQLNPILSAIEGNTKTFPTYLEMRQRYLNLVGRLEKLYPGRVARLTNDDLKQAYGVLKSFKKSWSGISGFLLSVNPHIQGIRKNDERDLERLYESIDLYRLMHNVRPSSFTYLLAIDSAFSRDELPANSSPGRAVLKPALHSRTGAVYNAYADLMHLELAVFALSENVERPAVFCTADWGIAGTWALFSPRNCRNEQGQCVADVRIPTEFAPLLPAPKRDALLQLLSNGG